MALTKISGEVIQSNIDISSTGIITATNFSGNLNGDVTGSVTGNVTGDLTGNVTGNINSSGVSTVTTLNATTISGVSTIGVTTATVTTLTVNGNNYPSAGPLSNRNKVINGAMQVSQRTTSESSISSSSTVRVLDRWQIRVNNTGTWTISQSTEAPPGFSKSIRWQCTTADASPAADDFQYMAYRFEGLDVQDLAKGTSSAKPVTVSFWVRSTVTGSYSFRLVDNQNNRQIGQNYTVNQADTWEHKTMTFAGDTTGALNSDSSNRLSMMWWLAVGSNRTSGDIPTSWETMTTADEAAGQTANIASSTSNNFYITGVQLEVGETATPFEHRSYGDELSLCQRYCQRFTYFTAPGVVSSSVSTWHPIAFPVEFRAAPSLTVNTLGKVVKEGTAWYANTALNLINTNVLNGNLNCNQSNNNMVALNATRLGEGCDLTFHAEL